jgi:crotonobetainyl-CoA:carnitine CoA-transferase CaiB-like acyl-CoA transferase
MTVQCSDGKWIQMCARQDHHFRNWLRVLDLDILNDPRFAQAPLGIANDEDADELEDLIRNRMARRTRDEWMRLFIDNDVGADPFLSPAEFMAEPQMHLNRRIVTVLDPEIGPALQLAPLFGHPDGIDEAVPGGAPKLDEFAGEVAEYLHRERPRWKSKPGATLRSPLEGKTILDMSYFLAGPVGATQMAELGARVIKIEPLDGDPFRRSGVEWAHLSHGKESLALDLKTERGGEVLHQLISRSDALLHSFRPGVAERLHFDYATCCDINPGLIYVYASSYGPKGPYANRPAFHSTPNALIGSGILQAGRSNPPVDDSWPDPVAACAVGTALALGLLWQARTGRGRYIETNMVASAGYAMSERLVLFPDSPELPAPDVQQLGIGATYRLYRCSDGWLFLALVSDADWSALVAGLGRSAIGSDPRFLNANLRRLHDEELAHELEHHFALSSVSYLEARLQELGVPCARSDEFDFPNFLLRNDLLTPADPSNFGPYYKLMPKVRFSHLETRVGEAPSLGQHTTSLLLELGYTNAEVQEMSTAGIIRVG